MKLWAYIAGVRLGEVDSVTFSQLGALEGVFTSGVRWELMLPEDHPSVSRARTILREAGLQEWHHEGLFKLRQEGKEFVFSRVRRYEAADFDTSLLIELRSTIPNELNEHIWRSDKSGRIEIQRVSAVKHKEREVISPFGRNGQGLIVSDEFRKVIENELRAPEIEFLPVDFKAKTKMPNPPVWWEITSRVTLPPVSPVLKLLDNRDQPIPRGHRGFTQIIEPPFAPRELHYIRSELEAVGDFTLARSFEKTGHAENDRCLIASQRFYRFCMDNNIKCDWIPVRIDDE